VGNPSPRTIETYTEAAHQLATFLADRGMPTLVANIRREHVEAFIEHLLGSRSPATARNRFQGLQRFFAWLIEEGEVTESPMKNMHPPHRPRAARPGPVR
jgi:integrase/recombinase XerC